MRLRVFFGIYNQTQRRQNQGAKAQRKKSGPAGPGLPAAIGADLPKATTAARPNNRPTLEGREAIVLVASATGQAS